MRLKYTLHRTTEYKRLLQHMNINAINIRARSVTVDIFSQAIKVPSGILRRLIVDRRDVTTRTKETVFTVRSVNVKRDFRDALNARTFLAIRYLNVQMHVKLHCDIAWKDAVKLVTIAHTRAVPSSDTFVIPNKNKVNELKVSMPETKSSCLINSSCSVFEFIVFKSLNNNITITLFSRNDVKPTTDVSTTIAELKP